MDEATSELPISVGVRELKNRLSSYLERVKAGQEITVTERGKPIARLTSIGPDVDRRAALIEAGIVRPATSARRKPPAKRVKLGPGPTVAELVAEQRR